MKATKHQIMNYIETGSFDSQPQRVGANTPESLLPDIWRECGGDQSVFDGIESVQVQGQLAYAALKFRQKESSAIVVLDVKLEDKGGYWQVVELTGLPECSVKLFLDPLQLAVINLCGHLGSLTKPPRESSAGAFACAQASAQRLRRLLSARADKYKVVAPAPTGAGYEPPKGGVFSRCATVLS